MTDNIEKFVNDMRKVLDFEKSYGKLEYTNQMTTSQLILTAVENDLIKSSLDLVYICNALPELSCDICRCFDAYLFKKSRRSSGGIRKLRALVKKEQKEQNKNRIKGEMNKLRK